MKYGRLLKLCAVLMPLLLSGCGGCGQPAPDPAPDSAIMDQDRNEFAALPTDSPAGSGIAYVTGAQGEAWSGSAGAEVQLVPGTKLIAAAVLRTGNGTLDLFFPECGVARLLAGTTVQVNWEIGTPLLTVTAGTVGLIAGGRTTAGLAARSGKLHVVLRAGVAALRAAAAGGEVAVATGDARVQVEERLLFVNAGELLLPGVNGEPPAVTVQDPSWPARFAALRGIMHADEFSGPPRAVPAAAAETTTLALRRAPQHGFLTVRRVSSQGVVLTGSCRIYDAPRLHDVLGMTMDFPGDMPVRLPADTYTVELVYTDIIYPPNTGVVVVADLLQETVFLGFGRLELRRALTASQPVSFRIHDLATGREVTRTALELPPGGGAVELLPGGYRVELINAGQTQSGFDRVVISERQTTTVDVRQ